MLKDFMEAIYQKDFHEADEISLEMTQIAYICAESKAVFFKKKCLDQDDIMNAMERTFAYEFTKFNLTQAKVIFDLVQDWECASHYISADQYKIATVQQFVLSHLLDRIKLLEILKLKDICNKYNEAICYDHALAFKKARHDPSIQQMVEQATNARAEAFLDLCHLLDEDKSYEQKMLEFVELFAKFCILITDKYPLEEANPDMFSYFSSSLKYKSKKMVDYLRHTTSAYKEFHTTVTDVIRTARFFKK